MNYEDLSEDQQQTYDIFKAACELLHEDGHDAEAQMDYSGRCMYGDTVPAIVTDAEASVMGAAVMVAALREVGGKNGVVSDHSLVHEAWQFIPGRFDTMGRNGRVFY